MAEVINDAYTDLVKTSDFNELKEIVRNLSLTMEELAEAQKETQKEVSRLNRALQELAEAQKRTEQRVEELAEAQKRTEQRVEELADAQKRTEEELRKLISEHAETRRQLGGLAITVGYRLEDEAFKALPKLLKKDYGLVVKGRLKRKFVQDNQGQEIEVNILGEGEREGEVYIIVGESKSQLSKRDVDDFIRRKLKRLEGVFPRMFPVLVTYMISQPGVEEYAQEKGIALYYSYDF
ncbi:MAG: hypothetical protein L5656_09140 [Thermanaeromonas sp.]|uniref:hypothetical protein n=1 Tax=Thermanaeromonas sp. TaxID=2003697 RepID=UPI0024382DB1|nr:hypothetical protein [Thermanaeromonas sp.]MCG0278675.1 hypothetical protein [Thermanaeromonas sp.]